MQTQSKSSKRSPVRTILIAVGVLAVACCGLSAIGAILSPRNPSASTATRAGSEASSTGATPVVAVTINQPAQAAPVATEPPPTETPVPPTATPVPLGSSKDNPAPIGTMFTAKEFQIVVNRVVRPADQVVAQGNMFNTKAEKGDEYVQVEVSITCLADAKSKCNVSPFNFKLYSSKGIVHDAEFVLAGVEGMLESTEFFGGATIESKSLFFLVGEDETNVVMEFEAGLIFRESAYFAIPDAAQ